MAGIILYGGGGHAKVVLDALQSASNNAQAIIDSKFEGDLLGVKRFKTLPSEFSHCSAVIAIGDNAVRKEISSSLESLFVNIIHSSAIISSHAQIGSGCMILHRSVVQAGSQIGNHVIINTGAQVDHDCVVGNFAHLAPGTILCGGVSIGEGTLVGAGAVVKPGVRIGAWATIGSGTVVVKDIPDYAVVVGNPGRVVKYIQP